MTVYGASWNEVARYVHGAGIDDPAMPLTGNTTGPDATASFYHQDGLGSIIAQTTNTGTTQGLQRFDAWGNKIQSSGTINQYGYTGREPDASGLIYYRARYYDPTIGRFTSRDPAGMPDGVNRYAYVGNDPVNFTDPSGLYADLLLDAGFIAFDIAHVIKNPTPGVAWTALGLDVVGAAIPFVTGVGQAYRTQHYLTGVANRADQINTAGITARGAGTAKHSEAEQIIRQDRRPNTHPELSCKGGDLVSRGTAGSKRPDVVTGSASSPNAAYDFKFGQKGVSQRDVRDIRSAIGNDSLPVFEIRPGAMPTRPYSTGYGASLNLMDDLGLFGGGSYFSPGGGSSGSQSLGSFTDLPSGGLNGVGSLFK